MCSWKGADEQELPQLWFQVRMDTAMLCPATSAGAEMLLCHRPDPGLSPKTHLLG